MSVRQQRVQELLKREIGEILRREFSIAQAGLLNVNEVIVSNDLQNATVYVGVVGTKEQRAKAVNLLDNERKRLQQILGRAVVLKYTPALKFVIDDSIERGNRVLEILDELDKS